MLNTWMAPPVSGFPARLVALTVSVRSGTPAGTGLPGIVQTRHGQLARAGDPPPMLAGWPAAAVAGASPAGTMIAAKAASVPARAAWWNT